MATVTLVANSTFASLTTANGDTIDCAGFILTIGVQPTKTGIKVVTTGTAGTVVISGAWDLTTWEFAAGTATVMIETVQAGSIIGKATGGSGSAKFCIGSNSGTVLHALGGSGTSASAILNNESGGIVALSEGGPGTSASGTFNNYGVVTIAKGGSLNASNGVSANYTNTTTAIAGGYSSAHGVRVNYGTIAEAQGGSVSLTYGCNINYGNILRATPGTYTAVYYFPKGPKFVIGPDFHGTVYAYASDLVGTIYSIGPLAVDAIFPAGTTIVELAYATDPVDSEGITTLLSRITGLVRTSDQDDTADAAILDAITAIGSSGSTIPRAS